MISTNIARSPNLQVIILAAGYSRRLGRSKALVRVHGVTLIRATLGKVSGLSRRIPLVIVPPRSNALRNELKGLAARCITNARRAAGQSSSVRLGLAHARYASAVLLLPCDLVALERRELVRLLTCWRATPRKIVGRRLPAQRVGAPVILPRCYIHAACSVSGDGGLRDFLRGIAGERRRLVEMPSADADVDTPLDLAMARRRWGARRVSWRTAASSITARAAR